jgi:hypothetical protein
VSASLGDLRPRIVLVLAGLFATTWIAAAPLDVMCDCAQRAPPGLSGIKSLEVACPELADALAALGLDDVLADGWRLRLSAYALRDLIGLQERYGGSKRRASPNTATLPEILEALKREQTPKPESWWSSFTSWLKEWLAQSDSSLARWLNRWLDWVARAQPSRPLLTVFTYCLGILVVFAAILVVLRELKAAGVLRRGARNAAARSRVPVRGAAGTGMVQMPMRDSLAELLRLLVARLLQTGRLKADRSLTHRELIARSAFDSESQRSAFAGVASAAECLLYGPKGTAPELGLVIERGQSLLAQLSKSTGTS